MPVNLANVNISLQQFQSISSGKYNAGARAVFGEALTRGAREIAEALNADASNLRGHQYLRLGNEVMLEASDF